MDKQVKTITTHSGTFHCDEVSACALLHVFTDDKYIINRIPHQAEIPAESDFVIDIGRVYNKAEGRFDHHQWEGGKSAAGLVWDYLQLDSKYPKISELIELIDHNDVGIRKAYPAELPRIIGCFNGSDIYDDEAQMVQFDKAIQVVITVLESMKAFQDEIDETEGYLLERLSNLSNWESENGVVIADRYLKGWNSILNGMMTPSIRCIMWPKGNDTDEWHAQVIPVEPGEYGLHGERFEPSTLMTFVHSNGFFCVAPDEHVMAIYLTKE